MTCSAPTERQMITCFHRPPNANKKLFLFPFAGGTKYSYRHWSRFDLGCELWSIEYPGHGSRISEPFAESIGDLVTEITEELIRLNFMGSNIFFGHSMGALVSFLVGQKLATIGSCPDLLVVSGHRPPHLPDIRPPRYELARQEFVDYIIDLDGTSIEVAENDELLDAFIPILRSDFRLCQTWRFEKIQKLQCPIVAMGGWNDSETDPETISHWSEHTEVDCTTYRFDGGHFFINNSTHVAPVIRNAINRIAARGY